MRSSFFTAPLSFGAVPPVLIVIEGEECPNPPPAPPPANSSISSSSSSTTSSPHSKYPPFFPLLSGVPRCLLPVGNRSLLSYQLETLVQSGASDIHVVSPVEYAPRLEVCLEEFARSFNMAYYSGSSGLGVTDRDAYLGRPRVYSHFSQRGRSSTELLCHWYLNQPYFRPFGNKSSSSNSDDGSNSSNNSNSSSISSGGGNSTSNNNSINNDNNNNNNDSNSSNSSNSSNCSNIDNSNSDSITNSGGNGDVVLMFADHFCQLPLGRLVNFHRSNASNLTVLLSNIEDRRSSVKESVPISRSDVVFDIFDTVDPDDAPSLVCYNSDHRVVLKSQFKALEKACVSATGDASYLMQKSLLEAAGDQASFRGDLSDVGLYVISSWFFEFMLHNISKNNKEMVNFRSQVVPHIIHRQFLLEGGSNQQLLAEFSNGANRYLERFLLSTSGLEKALINKATPQAGPEVSLVKLVSDELRNMLAAASNTNNTTTSTPLLVPAKLPDDLIRCFAFIVDPTEKSTNARPAPMTDVDLDPSPNPLFLRLSSLRSYFYLNKEVPILLNAWEEVNSNPLAYMPWRRTWARFLGATLAHDTSRSKKVVGFLEGDAVDCNLCGRGLWLPGRILRDCGNKTYDVVYDSGVEESRVSELNLRSSNWNKLVKDKERQLLIPTNMNIPSKDNCKSCCIGQNVKIDWAAKADASTFIMNCVIMDNVTIGPGSCLEGCVISEGTVIGPGCNLEGCLVGPGSQLGANCSLVNCRVKGRIEENDSFENTVIVNSV